MALEAEYLQWLRSMGFRNKEEACAYLCISSDDYQSLTLGLTPQWRALLYVAWQCRQQGVPFNGMQRPLNWYTAATDPELPHVEFKLLWPEQ